MSEYQHFTVLAEGMVANLDSDFDCPEGPAFMTMKAWATDADEAADMLIQIGKHLGFHAIGELQIFLTEAEQPVQPQPFSYDINFTAYDDEIDGELH
jgi:hypothetical protein